MARVKPGARTLAQKIFDARRIDTPCEGMNVVTIDRVLCHEITTPMAINDLVERKLDTVFDRKKIMAVIDHVTPAKDSKSAIQGKVMRDWARRSRAIARRPREPEAEGARRRRGQQAQAALRRVAPFASSNLGDGIASSFFLRLSYQGPPVESRDVNFTFRADEIGKRFEADHAASPRAAEQVSRPFLINGFGQR